MDNVEALQSCKPQPVSFSDVTNTLTQCPSNNGNILNATLPLQANYTLTLRTHNTFESFKTALETFVQEYNVGRKK